MNRYILISACLAVVGCGGRDSLIVSPDASACIPGEQIACACFDGRAGAQVCGANGAIFAACICDPAEGSAGGPASTGSGGAGAVGPIGGTGTAGALGTAGAGGTGATAGLGACSASKIAFDVVDAEYSASLDAVVVISSNPIALHVLDPVTLTDHSVALPKLPVAVSVSPDGMQAAVASDGFLSVVDLSGPTLVKTIATTCDAFDVVLAGNGFAYVFPKTDQWVDIHSVDIAQGMEEGPSQGVEVYAQTHAKLHPNGKTMYGSTAQLSPSDLEEYDASQGVARVTVGVGAGPDFGQHEACGEVWMSLDGERVFSACGNVFHAALDGAQDMRYAAKLDSGDGNTNVQSLVHSMNGKVYSIEGSTQLNFGASGTPGNDGVLDVFDYEYLSFEKTLTVPCLQTDTGAVAPHARFVFANRAGTKVWVLLEVGAGTTWGVAGIDP